MNKKIFIFIIVVLSLSFTANHFALSDSVAPSAPTIIASDPASGTTVPPGLRTVSLDWNPVAEATSYEWRLSPDPEGVGWRYVGGTTYGFDTVNLSPSQTYTMEAHACVAGGVCSSPSSVTFRTSSGVPVPSPPIILSSTPVNGSTVPPGTQTIVLDWGSVSGATSYEWKLTPDPIGVGWRFVGDSTIGTDTVNLSPSQTYTMEAHACVAGGVCSSPSSVTFYTGAAVVSGVPSPPIIDTSNPIDGAKDVAPGLRTVSLDWILATGATSYQWRPSVRVAYIDVGGNTIGSLYVNLLPNEGYRMEAIACNTTGCSTPSFVVFYTVGAGTGIPPAPTIDAPVSAKINSEVSIRVIATDDKDVKRVGIIYGDGGSDIGECPGVADTTCNLTFAPTYSSIVTYTIQARTEDSDGNLSAWASKQITISSAGPDGEPPVFGVFELKNPLNAQTLEALLDAIINFIFWLGIALAPVMLMIAGFFYVISANDPGRIKLAQNIALYTFIGLAVLLFAKGLVVVLISVLGG